ncbi:filamin-A isoform X2 [Chironomus tepperi]|uniref:filamin-A isoform X2 n=1 Tax=Chironomus tepperi TaxID=113505 RepID=UPI00391F936C
MAQAQALGDFLQSQSIQPRDYCDQEDEMIEAERDLAEDAEWKRIQQNTFTRWANEHLKIIDKTLMSLETDLSDGLALIALIEVLSQKKMSKHNKRPTFRSQKLENVSVALKFLEREGIKIINIDSTDIVDCKLKLILGLIWLLILHYSISMPMWESDTEAPNDKQTPKQRLLNWVKNRVPDLPIHNFTTDWNDGKAIGALVDNVAPGLCPDWASWDPKDALQNATEAMGLADDWLGVRQLIKPDEMTNPNIDEQSMMTYLSQYPSSKLKPGAPIRQRTNPNRVRCYGPGIEPSGPIVGAPANFTVETFSAGKGTVEVTVLNPNGLPEQVDCRFNNDKALTYSVSYIPKMEGQHKVVVNFNGRDVPKSPFDVKVEGVAGNAELVTASGPGLQADGVMVKRPTYFDIHTKDAGKGVPEVIILDPQGHKTSVAAKVRQIENNLWRCDYTPGAVGLHSVNVFYAGKAIPNSPFGVRVSPTSDSKKVRAFGRGLQPTGVRVGDVADFRISTEGAGDGVPHVQILGPGGQNTQFELKAINNSTFDGFYKPTKEGRYRVMITFAGQEIPKSPFDVVVGPKKESSIKAFGPGLHSGIVNKPARFVVETNGETGALGFSVAGPSQAKIECHDNGDGSALVTYHPTAPGEYAVHILCDEEDIPKSPFMSQVIVSPSDIHPENIKVYGQGIEPNSVDIGKKTQFTIDHKQAGVAPLEVKVSDSIGRPVPVQVVETSENVKQVYYTATTTKPLTVEVNYGGVAVPNSPFRVYANAPLDPSKVQVFGPFIDNPDVKPNQATHFIIDASEAGNGDLEVSVVNDATKQAVPINLIDNEDNTYTVEITPEAPGTYTTNLNYGGLKVPFNKKTVITSAQTSTVDVSKVQVEGLEQSVVMNGKTEFQVDMAKLGQKIDTSKLTCSITAPSGKNVPSKVISQNEVFKILYTPFEAGRHTIELSYDNVPIPGSPFVIHVKSGCDPSRCKAFGAGLQGGQINQKAKFTVSTREAGIGGLSFAIEGPSEAKMSCVDNRDGSCDVEFLPTEPGVYDISVRFADKHIPGSPFKVTIDGPQQVSTGDYRSVKLYGPAVETLQVYEGIPASFFINVENAGAGLIGVEMVSSEGGAVENYEVEERGDGNYLVTFIPPKQNTTITAKVSFAKHNVPHSPFVMRVLPPVAIKSGNLVMSGDISKKSLPASVPASFQVDTSKAGNGEIRVVIASPQGKPLVPRLERGPDGKYTVSFVPDELGPYNVSVLYAGKEIEGSPFILESNSSGDANKCKFVNNAAEKVIFGKKNRLTVDAREAGAGNVTCRINKSSDGKAIDTEIVEKDGFFDIFYMLTEPGTYDVDVKFGGKQVPNGLMRMTAVESLSSSEELQEVTAIEKHTKVSYTKQEYTESTVTETNKYTQIQSSLDQFLDTERDHTNQYITSNGETKKNGHHHYTNGKQEEEEFRQEVVETLHSSHKEEEHSFRSFTLDKLVISNSVNSLTHNIEADVTMPSGNIDKPTIEDNRDGTVSIRYDPREEGAHELTLKYNGENVQGSPFKFYVDSISSGFVTAYGPGLTHGVTGESVFFTISTKGAGAGGLSMAVEGPSKAEISYKDNKDGTVSVSYLPTAPGEYKISVRFGDKNIKGSPFFAKITGEGRKRNQISVGSCSEVTFPGKISDNDLRSLNASIQSPSGLEEPCFLKRMPSGNIGISFTPREAGEHIVSVKRMGKHINNSPFKVNVAEREVGDAKKVKVSGAALEEGVTHAENFFTVDTRNAGYGGLSLSIEGPSKAEIVCQDKEDGTLNISYKPTEPGYYVVNLKFADHHVEGSPFTVKVGGDGTNRKREKIQRQREAVPVTEVGSQCRLSFKLPGITSFDLSAQVTSPGNVTEDAEMQEIEDGLYSVFFVPKELGIHTVSVRYKEMHIPGSPFQFTVGPLRDTGSHLVKAGGPGLDHGEVGEKNEFNVWTREAGGGTLAISVEGPSKAEIDFRDRKDGSCDVSYVVSELGDYRVGIKFNDRHIPDSPFKVYIQPSMIEAHKLEVAQFPDGPVQPDKPAQFIVRKNGAQGALDAKVVAPSNTEDDCFIQLMDPDNYSVRFYPRENGIHAIHTKFNGVHIPGSPFRIKVGKDDADPAAVHASGDGLHEGKTGQKGVFIIDTCNAGCGLLSVTMDGPSKVSMDCTEIEEGYKVRYTPLLPGDYYCTIKYNHCHIVGSPYKIVVGGDQLADGGGQETTTVNVDTVVKFAKTGKSTGPFVPVFNSDANKVQAKGLALKKAYIGKQNNFTVNCSNAGNNILYVGMYGPKGPCEECYIKHTGRNNYSINYVVREKGEYVLMVKWGEEHVPGSPYRVEC